uniref:Peptidase M60 domain-containing protein n=1 Tax=Periophthalmus magnuspinnatus TaxID=409849 RepID=A0A3B3ZVG6_9GOBI
MRAVADLAAIPPKFVRKERIVCDVQIFAGEMYPIMAHNATAEDFVMAKEHQDLWGPIHELGHNQQRGCWEFPPHTTDAANNLWSVYVEETVLKIPRDMLCFVRCLKSGIEPLSVCTFTLTSVCTFTRTFNSHCYFGLVLQLQENFGWHCIKSVFGTYHKIKDVPSDNKGQMNLYCVTFSETVRMVLTRFFKTRLSILLAWTGPLKHLTSVIANKGYCTKY